MIDYYCIDCREFTNYLDDDSVDLVIADPPYLVTNQKWDKDEVFDDYLVSELRRILKPTGNIYIWCGIGEKSQSLIRWFPLVSKYFYFKDLITWKKQRGFGMRKGWLYTREELMWFVKDNTKYRWNGKEQYSEEKREKSNYGYKNKKGELLDKYIKSDYKRITNVWTDISETSFNTMGKDSLVGLHFTPKPIGAISRIIKLHTTERDLIFDPFMGSGNTAIVANKMNRNFIGCEINPDYIELINKRLKGGKS